MLSVLRRRRAFTKVVLWILVAMISISMLAWFGGGMGSISSAPQPSQTQQQGSPGTSQQ